MGIAIIGTLDTKGSEVGFLRDEVRKRGHKSIVFDPGVLGEPAIAASVTREEIARAGGEELSSLIERGDKTHAQETMVGGLVNLVSQRYANGQIDGVVAVGGSQGTAIATAAMRALPVGVPKVMVSTVACGKTTFGPYVGTKDITIIHSVADILGLNRITRCILAQAAAAVTAMASVPRGETDVKELVAITQAGITTPGVMAVKQQLEDRGFEVIAFHCNGIGGQAMEELILNGSIKGVIDFSPHEITDLLYGGLMPAMPERLRAAGKMGIPQLLTPGATDIRLHGPPAELSDELRGRAHVLHTPGYSHVRTTPKEMSAVAQFIAERLNEGRGPRAVMVPLRGYSMLNRQGEALYDDEANRSFARTIRDELSSQIALIELDDHINDPAFAKAVVGAFMRLRGEGVADSAEEAESKNDVASRPGRISEPTE